MYENLRLKLEAFGVGLITLICGGCDGKQRGVWIFIRKVVVDDVDVVVVIID